MDLKLCSPGRARALLALMRFAGYLAPKPGASDHRQRRLMPTKHLIEVQRQRWECQFEAMALFMPEGRKALEVHDRPEFTAAFLRHLGSSYLAGFRPLDYAPELARLAESNAGLLVISNLFLSAADGLAPGGTVVPISISALAARFGIARAHARKLLAGAAEAGLVRPPDGSETVIVLPRLGHALGNFFATVFALLAHCADASAKEIGSVSWPAMPAPVADLARSHHDPPCHLRGGASQRTRRGGSTPRSSAGL